MQKRLSYIEEKINKSRKSFYEIGRLLKEIRDKKLYQVALFRRFETYTKERWDIGRSKAYRLINACNVIDNLSPIGDRSPSNEAQVRALTKLSKEEQRIIWHKFLASGMEVNALNINNFIMQYKSRENPKKTKPDDTVSESYKSAVLVMIEQIQIAQNENWTFTSRQAALMWNRVMREKILFNPGIGSGGKNE